MVRSNHLHDRDEPSQVKQRGNALCAILRQFAVTDACPLAEMLTSAAR